MAALLLVPPTLVAYQPFSVLEPVTVAKLVCTPAVNEIALGILTVPSASKLCEYESASKLVNESGRIGSASTLVTVRIAVPEVKPLRLAVIVVVWLANSKVLSVTAATANVAEEAPSAMVTEEGTVASVVSLETNVIANPLAGATTTILSVKLDPLTVKVWVAEAKPK